MIQITEEMLNKLARARLLRATACANGFSNENADRYFLTDLLRSLGPSIVEEERERCAALAEKQAENASTHEKTSGEYAYVAACEAIAEAIRGSDDEETGDA